MIDQAELAAIAADVKRRSADLAWWESRDNPHEVCGADAFPAPVLKGLLDFGAWVAGELGLDPVPQVRWFTRRPVDRHLGVYFKRHPREVWIGTGQSTEQTADTIAHEMLHDAGLDDESEVRQRAAEMVREYLGPESMIDTNVPAQVPQFFGGF